MFVHQSSREKVFVFKKKRHLLVQNKKFSERAVGSLALGTE